MSGVIIIHLHIPSLHGQKHHNHLVEEIKNRAVTLNKKNWKIEFKRVKAQAGIYGNEIADRLAKEATQNYYVTYSRIPNCAIKKIPGKKA
jgi:ribonuclease HI